MVEVFVLSSSRTWHNHNKDKQPLWVFEFYTTASVHTVCWVFLQPVFIHEDETRRKPDRLPFLGYQSFHYSTCISRNCVCDQWECLDEASTRVQALQSTNRRFTWSIIVYHQRHLNGTCTREESPDCKNVPMYRRQLHIQCFWTWRGSYWALNRPNSPWPSYKLFSDRQDNCKKQWGQVSLGSDQDSFRKLKFLTALVLSMCGRTIRPLVCATWWNNEVNLKWRSLLERRTQPLPPGTNLTHPYFVTANKLHFVLRL